MADKATRLPNLQIVPGAAASDAVNREIEQISAGVAAANKKKAKAEERKTNVPDEVKVRNWQAINDAIAVRKAVEKELKKAKSIEAACWSTAKSDGCNITAFQRVLREQKIDSDEFDLDMREAAYVARLVGSPLAETSFMRILDDADKVNHYTQGFTAGKAGDDLANCPHQPGTVEFEKYEKGWRDGQAKIAEGLGRGKKAAAKAKAAAASAKIN